MVDIARFFDGLIRCIEYGERQTHIWHDGDRKSRLIKFSMSEEDVGEIIEALRKVPTHHLTRGEQR